MKLNSTAWILAALMCGATVAGIAARPSTKAADRGNAITLETAVPKDFGEWRELPDQNDPGRQSADQGAARQALQPDPDPHLRRTSRATGSCCRWPTATTSAAACRRIARRSAIRRRASSSARSKTARLPTSFGTIEVRRLTTELGPRNEPVTYWLTVGDQVIRNTLRQADRRDPPRPHRPDSRRPAVSRLVDRQRHRRGRSRCSRSSPPT